uniref:Antibacterial factor-related peptide 2 n=1 Tax=Caenorhabditis elegans TaxID=6239 RepID=UPI0009B4EB91
MDIDFSTCARMDVPILKKAAQGLCITSCSMQNCGTGSCKKRSGRPTCVCYRCANGGGDIPLGALIKRG